MKAWAVVGLIGTAVLLGGGTSGWLVADEDDHRGSWDDLEDVREVLTVFEVLASDLVSPAAAREAAVKAHPGRAAEIELGAAHVKGKPVAVWEIAIVANGSLTEVTVNARTGEVVAAEKEDDEEELEDFQELLEESASSLGTVLETLERSVEGRVVKVQIDEEGEIAVWEAVVVHSGWMSEIVLSARSGKILPTSDDDEEDEDEEDEDDDEDEEEEDEDD